MEFSLEKLGFMSYTLPAAMLVIISRQWLRWTMLQRFKLTEESNPLMLVDPFAIAVLSFFSVSWGSNLGGRSRDNIITYLASQIWLLILITLTGLYYHLHKPAVGSYTEIFILHLMRLSWNVFLFNLIPFPPSDAAFFAGGGSGRSAVLNAVNVVFKLAATCLLLFDALPESFLKADIIFRVFSIHGI